MMNNKEKNSVIVRTHAFPGKKETRRHVRQLKRGRTKSLGPIESLQLRLIGLDDGRRGLPKEVGQYDGYEWSSAFIQKETDAWEEFCNRAWGLEQVALERYHVRASVLVSDIAQLEGKLQEIEAEYTPPQDESYYSTRKRGEELCSDAQVQARRRREVAKQLAKVRSAAASVKDELEEKCRELAHIHRHIVENENDTRMICERVMNHSKQRISAYWRAAERVHPEKDRMPAAPTTLTPTDAERTYTEDHRYLNDAITGVLTRYSQSYSWKSSYERKTDGWSEKEISRRNKKLAETNSWI